MIRAARAGDLEQAPVLLRRAFSGYRDALVYSPDVVAMFRRLWWTPLHGVAAERNGRLVGLALVGVRAARFGTTRLQVAHVGPVAVEPEFQGQGLGDAMMAALAPPADLMTLTTNDSEDIRGFYLRRDFRVLSRWVPLVRNLNHPRGGSAIPPTALARPIVEASVEAGRSFRAGSARIRAIQWPVTSRRSGHLERLKTCQILSRHGDGRALGQALDDACAWARRGRCELVWGEPHVTRGLPGFRSGGGAGVSRLVRPLTPTGAEVAEAARGWMTSGPSP